MNKAFKQRLVKVVQAIGKSISDNAESIVGDYELGQEIHISAEYRPGEVPSVSAERVFTTPDIIDALLWTVEKDGDSE